MPNHGAATGQRYNFLIAATLTESIFKPVSLEKDKLLYFFMFPGHVEIQRNAKDVTKINNF